jgi:hypothetical protein
MNVDAAEVGFFRLRNIRTGSLQKRRPGKTTKSGKEPSARQTVDE